MKTSNRDKMIVSGGRSESGHIIFKVNKETHVISAILYFMILGHSMDTIETLQSGEAVDAQTLFNRKLRFPLCESDLVRIDVCIQDMAKRGLLKLRKPKPGHTFPDQFIVKK